MQQRYFAAVIVQIPEGFPVWMGRRLRVHSDCRGLGADSAEPDREAQGRERGGLAGQTDQGHCRHQQPLPGSLSWPRAGAHLLRRALSHESILSPLRSASLDHACCRDAYMRWLHSCLLQGPELALLPSCILLRLGDTCLSSSIGTMMPCNPCRLLKPARMLAEMLRAE